MPRESIPSSRTLGIDLAAQPERTAACLINWKGGTGRVWDLADDPLDDAALLNLIGDSAVTKVGIDAPFGWPDRFVLAVNGWRASEGWPASSTRELRFRLTDEEVREHTGQIPLSVSSEKIAVAAMRCASLLTAASESERVDRSGAGRFVEVYPAAALRQWKLSPSSWPDDPGSYKGRSPTSAARRARLVSELRARLLPAIELSDDQAESFEHSDDALDAFLCALIAHLAEANATIGPTAAQLKQARREGWIHLPRARDLLPG